MNQKAKKRSPAEEKQVAEAANYMMSIIEQLSASLKKATSHQKKLPPIPKQSVVVAPAVQSQKQTK